MALCASFFNFKTMKNSTFQTLQTRAHLVLTIFLVATVFVGCKKRGCLDPNALNYDSQAQVEDNSCTYADFNRAEMLENLCENYIIPAYNNFNVQTSNLNNLATAFSNERSLENFVAMKNQWREALLVWQDVSFIDFGPAEFIVLKNQVNLFPVDTVLINSNISNGGYNLEHSSNNVAKGFQALDFLLNQPNLSDSEHVNYFVNDDDATSYVLDITTNLRESSQSVVDNWSTYRSNFKDNNSSNAAGSSVSNLVNGLCSYYETYIRKGKIGLPLGVFNGFSQQEMPELVECYFYQQSLPFAYRAVESMKKYINGQSYSDNTNGLGLDDYMDHVGATSGSVNLSVDINNQIDKILTALLAINDPLSNEILTNKDDVVACYSKLQELVPLMKVDMTSALGVLITYQDNDGD